MIVLALISEVFAPQPTQEQMYREPLVFQGVISMTEFADPGFWMRVAQRGHSDLSGSLVTDEEQPGVEMTAGVTVVEDAVTVCDFEAGVCSVVIGEGRECETLDYGYGLVVVCE